MITVEHGLNRWELEEAQKALAAGEPKLAARYIDKALEHVRCMHCHGPQETRAIVRYFKGWLHVDCWNERHPDRPIEDRPA